MKNVDELIALKYADSTIPESWVFEGGSPDVRVPISFVVYLLKAGDRRILVDAGCETMPGFDMRGFISPVEALRKVGVAAEEITDLILTHAHHDHIEAVNRFPNAVVYIQQDELPKGSKYIPETQKVCTFENEMLVADAARAVCIGGHSTGSSVVECLLDGQPCVICGDECYSSQCFERMIPTGSSQCPEKSRAFLQTYAEGYRRFLCHDPI